MTELPPSATVLLLLYSGVVFINVILFGILYFKKRTHYHRAFLFVWLSTLTMLFMQGVLPQSQIGIISGFSFCYLISISLAHCLSLLTGMKCGWPNFFIGIGIGYGLSLVFHFLGMGFTLVALPTTLGVVLPLTCMSVQTIRHKWKELTFSGKGLTLSCIILVLHALDFPFLRDKPEFVVTGFTIAIFVVFSLSIFSLSTMEEILAKQDARIKSELDLARAIQQNILPKSLYLPGYEIECYMKSADEVGGDYYDVYLNASHSWLLIGDVVGHGLSSGLIMFMVQSIIKSVLKTNEAISPKELNFLANQILSDNLKRLNGDKFLTMSIASIRFNPQSRQFVVNGSHENMYIYRNQKHEVEVIPIHDFPFGLGYPVGFDYPEINLSEIRENTFELEPNDLLFVGTDGVINASKEGDYMKGIFGEDRLKEFILRHGKAPLPLFKHSLLSHLDAFTQSVYYDDMSFLMLRPLG